MDDQKPSHARLAASIILVLIIGASLVGAYYLRMNSAPTNTSAFTTTGSSGQLLLSKTWGPWVYDVSINSTSVNVGGALLVSGELTYHGQANTTIYEVEPTNGLSVFNSTGGLAWQYTPSEITVKVTVTPGETLGSPICVPVTTASPAPAAQNHYCDFAFRQQPLPGVYSMEAGPQFYSYPGNQYLGSNLLITANFTVF